MAATFDIDGVSVAYPSDPSRLVLESIDFSVQSGEIVAVLGPSGCGKSTLMLVLAGFLEVLGGRVLCNGELVTQPDRSRILLTQSDSILPWQTALENVEFVLRCSGVDKASARIQALNALVRVGLHGAEKKYPKHLSGGMRQRVGLARVFALRPQVLLLDEPFAALDEITRTQINLLFLELIRETKGTVVFVTHSCDEALILSDRIVVMGKGGGQVLYDALNPLRHPRHIEDIWSQEARLVRLALTQSIAAAHSRG